MPLENADFIAELNPLWPLGTDGLNNSDDHHRVTKRAIQNSFPNIDKSVTATADDLNQIAGAATGGSPAGLAPAGTVIMGAWAVAPNGYLPCDGAAIDPQYIDLIAIVGPNTPDLRGQFLRGWSEDATVDPDGPRPALDQQADAFQEHVHPTSGGGTPALTGASGDNKPIRDQPGDTGGASGRTASETRPKNTALLFVIKW
jgi:hypothetical protein